MAQVTTLSRKPRHVYSDITNNFTKNPVTNELVIVHNEDAVTQALHNLILTNPGERLFNPFFGSGVTGKMFEPVTPFIVDDLIFNIDLCVRSFEPRVNLISVSINDDEDNDLLGLSVTYSILNKAPITTKLFIQRVR